MNAARGPASSHTPSEAPAALGDQWRALRRAATVVALIASPAVYLWLHDHVGISTGWAIAITLFAVIAMRGAMDLVFRRFIPWPSLFGAQDARLAEEDVLNRRRAWFWKSFFRWAVFLGAPGTGKTMLAKAIATGFNSPIITIPGSGFAQTFIGIDALMVRYLARKAKRLASKWGGSASSSSTRSTRSARGARSCRASR